MNYDNLKDHPFWGPNAPLATLTGAALLILASGRTAYALLVLGALLWHHALLILILNLTKPIFPRKGKDIVVFFLSGVVNSSYLLFLFLLNPLLALEIYLYCLLAPVHAYASRLASRLENSEIEDALFRAVSEAASAGVLIVALALIREPLGFGSLSLPGGSGGIIRLFVSGESVSFPIRIFTSSSGALILLGYGVALFNRLREIKSKTEQDSE
ncbi:MAG: hypothetical protein LBP80_08485 [Treponema sp.]|nr:hypothetical protein [Treponema sp.]